MKGHWRALRLVVTLAAAGIAAWVVVQHRDELSGAGSVLAHLRWPWAVLALGVEACSYVAYAGVEEVLLRAGGLTPGMPVLTAITMAGNAIQNSLPGGPAWAAVYAFRQFRRLGADDVLAAWSMVAVAMLSNISLAVLAGIGLVIAGAEGSEQGVTGAIAGIVVVAIVAAVVLVRRHGLEERIVTAVLVVWFRIRRRVSGGEADPRAEAAATWARVGAVTPRKLDWLSAAVLAVVNWVFDIACLVGATVAVGATVPWRGLLLAYGAAQLASGLPFTPGGLGVVEGSLAIALVAFGAAERSAVAAVLLYRLFSFWLPLLVGWSSWGVIAWRTRGALTTPDAALEEVSA